MEPFPAGAHLATTGPAALWRTYAMLAIDLEDFVTVAL